MWKYQCSYCLEWFNMCYLYCPKCGEYQTASGMTTEMEIENDEDSQNNEETQMDDVKIVYKNNMPYGIRNSNGFFNFLRKYRNLEDKMNDIAMKLKNNLSWLITY